MAVKPQGEKWIFELDAIGTAVSWGYDSEDAATRAMVAFDADVARGGKVAELAWKRAVSGVYVPIPPPLPGPAKAGNLAAAHAAKSGWDRG